MTAAELEKRRTKLDLTREELARLLKVSYTTVYRWEVDSKASRKIPPFLDLALDQIESTLKKASKTK